MSKAQEKREAQQEAIRKLREWLKPGDTIHTILRHVSRSGMSRRIDLYVMRDGNLQFLSYLAATAMDDRWDADKGGIIVGGCGMDMGFSLVYNLGYTLFPKGVPCTGSSGYLKNGKKAKSPRCRSSDHSNGDREYKRGKIHVSGGYAFNQEWI